MRTERAARAASRRTPAVSARSAGWLSIIVALAICLLRLAGSLLHETLFISGAPTWTEMKPITLVCLLFCAGALTLIYRRPPGSRRSIGAMVLGSLVGLVGLATVADYVVHIATGRLPTMTDGPILDLFLAAATRMALITAVVFTLVGSSLVLLGAGVRRAANVAHALAFLAAIASYVVPLGYLLGVPAMSAVLGTAMALNTGIAFCFLCLAAFCARTDTWLMQVLTGDETGGYMAQRLLPALMATPLIIGWFRLQGERTGLFNSEVGVALVAATYTVVFVVLVWLAARAANRTDARRRAAEHTARESDERYHELFTGSPIGIYRTTPDGQTLAANPTLVKLLGYESLDELTRRNLESGGFEPSHARSEFKAAMERDGRVTGLESAWRKRDGTIVYLRENARAIRDPRGRITYYDGTVEDITERRNHESRIARLTRLYSVLSTVSEAIVRTRDEVALLDRVCTIVAEDGGFPLVWVGRVEGQEVQPVAVCGPAADYMKEIRVEVTGTLGSGPTGTSIREDRPVANDDFDTNATTTPWREPARRHGFRASVSLPLHRGGKVTGALTIYALERGAFDAEELRLLESLCADVSYAFDAFETERRRRQTEETLRASEERYRKLYSSMSEGLALHEVVYDDAGLPADYRILDVNPAFEAITGISRAKAAGRLASDLYGTGSPPYIDTYAKVAETGKPAEFETEFAPMAKCFHISVFSPETGTFATVFADITARKLAEEAVRDAHARLTLAQRSAAAGMWDWDMTAEKLEWSPELFRLFGLDPALDTATFETWRRIMHPDDRTVAEERVNAAVRNRARLESEYRIVLASGGERWVSAFGDTMYDAAGLPLRMSGICVDITERKRAEEALRMSEERFRAVAFNTPDHILVQDRELRYELVVNPQLGLTEQDMLGKTDYDFLSESDADRLTAMKRQVMQTGQPLHVEAPLTSAKGELELFEGTYVPRFNPQGRSNGVIGYFRNVTERKRAEEALRRSEATLRGILDAARESIWLFSADGVVLQGNATALGRFGKTGPEVVGKTLEEILTPELARLRRARLRQVVESARPVEFEDERAGIQFRHSFYPVLDAEGRVLAVASFSRDITESRRAELALRESEERYRTLFSTMEEGFCIIEMVFDAENKPVDYRFLEVNSAFENQTGLHEATGKLMRDLAPDHEAYWFEIYGKVALTGEPARFNSEAKALNRWYDVHAYRVGRPEDRRVAILFSDISDVKRAEEALREAKETLEVRVKERTIELTAEVEERRRAEEKVVAAAQYARSLLESSLDPLVTISADGKITDVNEATIKATGLPREQLIGTDFSDYFTEPEKAREGYRRVFAKTFITDYPLTICHRDGHLTDVLYNASVYKDTRGNIIGVFAAARDITERKRAEQALQKAHDSLEVKVAERTADLTRSNADLEQFAYAASHDLQEPLRMVANYVGLLSQRYREHIDEKADRYIDYAVGGAKRMQALVDGLLHYSRVGTKEAAATELDVTAVAAEARANLSRRIEETGAVLEVGPLPVVVADRVQLVQVFQNLLDNAIKFHGQKPPVVSVSCRDVGTEWEFAVRDNGIGIDPKYAERIFGVFKRLHTEQEYPGTGIGLALCRKIVERHGGRIHVEPAEGGGSVFLFTLPKKRPAAKRALQPEEV